MTSVQGKGDEHELAEFTGNDIFDILLGPDRLNRTSRTPSKRVPLLELYKNGLLSGERQLPCDVESFHKVVKEAVSLCAKGWPATTREIVRDGLVSDNDKAFPHQLQDEQTRISISEMAIDFGLRMWLMLDCCGLDSPGRYWHWPSGMSLSDFVKASVDADFSAGVSYQDDVIKKFPRKFTARHLEKIARIEIQRTDFLSEHLVFNEAKGNNGTLSIFAHKGWLMRMLELQMLDDSHNPATAIEMPVCGLPRKLIEETFYSLKLLCPDTNSEGKDWLKMKDMHFPPERATSQKHPSHTPHLREFTYLRERLLDLIEEYQAPPRHWKNVFTDRRNPTTFWTFWIGAVIGALTLVFGIFAIVLGILTLERTH